MKISSFFRSFCKFFSSAGALFNKARYPNWHCGLNVELNISRSQITADGKVYIGAYSRFYFNKESNLYIGNNVNFGRDVHLQADGSTIEIGHGTSIQDHCRIYGNVHIGNYTIFAPNVFVSSGTHIYDALPSRLIIDQERLSSVKDKPVFIGDDCWIGINAVVMQGVTIGKGCIVGANSVVTKDVPPYSVVAGAPATLRKIRYNFKPPQYIFANEINDQPYFYSGFDYLNLHPEFGYPTGKSSCVALFLDGATTLTIKLYSQNLPAHMRFEGKDYWISPGWNEIKIPACSQVFYNLEISGPCFIMSASLLV